MVARSPFEGLRRFTSAMTPIPRRAQRRRHVPWRASAARRLISVKSTAASRAASRTPSTMESRTLPPLPPRCSSSPYRACRNDMLDSPAVTAAARIVRLDRRVPRAALDEARTPGSAGREGRWASAWMGSAASARWTAPSPVARRPPGRRRCRRPPDGAAAGSAVTELRRKAAAVRYAGIAPAADRRRRRRYPPTAPAPGQRHSSCDTSSATTPTATRIPTPRSPTWPPINSYSPVRPSSPRCTERHHHSHGTTQPMNNNHP